MILVIAYISNIVLLLVAVIRNNEKFIKDCLIPFIISTGILPMIYDYKFRLSLGGIVACVITLSVVKLLLKLSVWISEASAYQVLATTTIYASAVIYITSHEYLESVVEGFSISLVACPLLLLIGNGAHAIYVSISTHLREKRINRKLRRISSFVNSSNEAIRIYELFQRYKVKSSQVSEIISSLKDDFNTVDVDRVTYIIGVHRFDKLVSEVENLLLQTRRIEMYVIQDRVAGDSLTGFFISKAIRVLIDDGKVKENAPHIVDDSIKKRLSFYSHVSNSAPDKVIDLDDLNEDDEWS